MTSDDMPDDAANSRTFHPPLRVDKPGCRSKGDK
jgi:hypothetical protein